ncbi:2Fe-2S iron-sulfur cluster-binding protein [Paremcibacter congregatus]|uniref:2Fe-2S iron-sulfur cluster-binding protein n=1 Tax=Paremcibacter congregatus TaxID=2043170 RepID=UPI0030EF7F5A|tara:strand:- start:2343 stop:2660 length:318 start_codon:yes stop_codon:yes gene_type:complete
MTRITFISPDNQHITVDAPNGESLMEAAVEHDVPGIDADCGGGCACATCHVILSDELMAALLPIDEDEQYLLDFLDNRQKNSRLSCQINVSDKLDGMIITIPKQA